MNSVNNGLWFRIAWFGFGVSVAIVSMMEFYKTKNYGDLLLIFAWLLMAVAWFMQPVIMRRGVRLSEFFTHHSSYAIGSPFIRIACSMIGPMLLVIGLYLKQLN